MAAPVPTVAHDDVEAYYCPTCDYYGHGYEMTEFERRGYHGCGTPVDVLIRANLAPVAESAYYRPCPSCGATTHVRSDGRWRRHQRPDGGLCDLSSRLVGED